MLCSCLRGFTVFGEDSISLSPISFSKQQDDQFIPNCLYDNIDELTRESLTALNAMKIKFPGKSDEQACDLLDAVSYHRTILFS